MLSANRLALCPPASLGRPGDCGHINRMQALKCQMFPLLRLE